MGAKTELEAPPPLASLRLPVLRRSITEDISLQSRLGRGDEPRPSGLVCQRDSSLCVLRHLTEMGLQPKDAGAPLALLEVGATETHLMDCTWLDTEAIHPTSRHTRIRRANLADLSPRAHYNVIVHHAPPTPQPPSWRDVLHRCHSLLLDHGHLFLTLPRARADGPLLQAFQTVGLRVVFHQKQCAERPALVICRREPPPPVTTFTRPTAGGGSFGVGEPGAHPLFAPFLLAEPLEA